MLGDDHISFVVYYAAGTELDIKIRLIPGRAEQQGPEWTARLLLSDPGLEVSRVFADFASL